MPAKRIVGPKRKGYARPMTQRERDYWEELRNDPMSLHNLGQLQAKGKKSRTKKINPFGKAKNSKAT